MVYSYIVIFLIYDYIFDPIFSSSIAAGEAESASYTEEVSTDQPCEGDVVDNKGGVCQEEHSDLHPILRLGQVEQVDRYKRECHEGAIEEDYFYRPAKHLEAHLIKHAFFADPLDQLLKDGIISYKHCVEGGGELLGEDEHCQKGGSSKYHPGVASAVLDYGDYTYNFKLTDGKWLFEDVASAHGHCVIERKMNLDELSNCFCHERDRFRREFERAAENNATIYLLVEDATWENLINGKYRSKFNPKAFLSSITAWSARYHFKIVFCKHETSGKLIREILYRELKERLETGFYE